MLLNIRAVNPMLSPPLVVLSIVLKTRLRPTCEGIFKGPSMRLMGALLLKNGTLLICIIPDMTFPPLRCLVSPLFILTPCPPVMHIPVTRRMFKGSLLLTAMVNPWCPSLVLRSPHPCRQPTTSPRTSPLPRLLFAYLPDRTLLQLRPWRTVMANPAFPAIILVLEQLMTFL